MANLLLTGYLDATSVKENGILLSNIYAKKSHNHTKSEITDFPSSMKNPHSLTIQGNGSSLGSYDGSVSKTINITKSSIGLGKVENKSSSTIRGELTETNVTNALGYTPVKGAMLYNYYNSYQNSISEGSSYTLYTPSSYPNIFFVLLDFEVSGVKFSTIIRISDISKHGVNCIYANGTAIYIQFTLNAGKITINRLYKEGNWANYSVKMYWTLVDIKVS